MFPAGWLLHGVSRLIAAQRAGQVVLDLLLRVALILVTELHTNACSTFALGAFRCHPDDGSGNRDLLVLAHQVQQHENLVTKAIGTVGRNEQTAIDDIGHVRQIERALVP